MEDGGEKVNQKQGESTPQTREKEGTNQGKYHLLPRALYVPEHHPIEEL